VQCARGSATNAELHDLHSARLAFGLLEPSEALTRPARRSPYGVTTSVKSEIALSLEHPYNKLIAPGIDEYEIVKLPPPVYTFFHVPKSVRFRTSKYTKLRLQPCCLCMTQNNMSRSAVGARQLDANVVFGVEGTLCN
jgi:hypothetical protein